MIISFFKLKTVIIEKKTTFWLANCSQFLFTNTVNVNRYCQIFQDIDKCFHPLSGSSQTSERLSAQTNCPPGRPEQLSSLGFSCGAETWAINSCKRIYLVYCFILMSRISLVLRPNIYFVCSSGFMFTRFTSKVDSLRL